MGSNFAYGYPSRGPAHPDEALRPAGLLKKFADYPGDRKLSGPDAEAVLWAVAGRVADEVDLEELELTGVPEWAGLYGVVGNLPNTGSRKLRQPF